jgi:hypothetical protein
MRYNIYADGEITPELPGENMTRDDIINDLIRNRPRGPSCTKITYVVEENYDYDSSRYKKNDIPSHVTYGYTNEDLFDLGFKDRASIDIYIRTRDFNGSSNYTLGRKKATVTRRVNRLWSRISDSVHKVKRSGGRGIYKIIDSPYHGDLMGHLYAETKEEANITAKIYFGYLLEDTDRLRVEYIRRGSVIEMKSLNENLVADIDKKIASVEADQKRLEQRISDYTARKTTVATVESQQTAVEMINTLDALETNNERL